MSKSDNTWLLSYCISLMRKLWKCAVMFCVSPSVLSVECINKYLWGKKMCTGAKTDVFSYLMYPSSGFNIYFDEIKNKKKNFDKSLFVHTHFSVYWSGLNLPRYYIIQSEVWEWRQSFVIYLLFPLPTYHHYMFLLLNLCQTKDK